MEAIRVLVDYGLPFIPILTLVVFVHELGHFLVARYNGVRVEAFSIGFGPELFGWTDKAGTRWRVAALPLGGFVKMFGDTDAASTGGVDPSKLTPEEQAVSFHHKRVGQRSAVVVAGPAANFLFAIVLMTALFSTTGQQSTAPKVATVDENSAAAAAGIQPGDLIRSIDGHRIDRFEDMLRVVRDSPGVALPITLERGGETVSLTATPATNSLTDRFGWVHKFGQLGIRSSEIQTVRYDPATAAWRSVTEIWDMSVMTLKSLGEIIIGARSTDDLGGVLRIAHMSGEVARSGVVTTLTFIALLSINLGLINLFPIPVLDGGHLMFYAAEALRGRPLGRRVQEFGSLMGLAAVMALMVFATWNDLVHIGVVARIASLFG
jgi:regulator of sigma E protease